MYISLLTIHLQLQQSLISQLSITDDKMAEIFENAASVSNVR
jgi:hypothetical protein